MGSLTYDALLALVRDRASVRKLKADPIPDADVEKILEVGRWAMSGGNAQPWEFVVVKNAATKQALFDAYAGENGDYIYWMEQQREFTLRHPAYQMLQEKHVQQQRLSAGWADAPVVIVLLGDGRRQWASVQGAMTNGRFENHMGDGLANASMLMHLAAGALGLGSQHVTVHIEEPFKRILKVPDLLRLTLIMPIGYPAIEPKRGVRRPLDEMVHDEQYDQAKFMSNENAIKFLYDLRNVSMPMYRHSYIGDEKRG